jgi:hypothetical protein
MSVQALGSTIAWTYNIAVLAVCIVLPFRYVLRTGRFRRGVVFVWIAAAVLSFCFVALGQYLRLNVDKSLANYCPEGPHFLIFALLGWWPGLLVSGTAYLLFARRKRLAINQERVNDERLT